MSNPAEVAPQSALVYERMNRDNLFLVVYELFMTDTALFADIILIGSFLEITLEYMAWDMQNCKESFASLVVYSFFSSSILDQDWLKK